MAHGLNAMLKRGTNTLGCKNDGKTGIGSRRIFAPQFKLQVLDSYRNDADCKGNQRATARKYGIHRRQIQKWLQVENNLRNSVIKSKSSELIVSPEARKCGIELALRSVEHRQRDDVCSEAYSHRQRQVETSGAELECGTDVPIGGPESHDETALDKRVPDIPQQHNSTNSVILHYEWHPQQRSSPDTSSSSERDVASYIGVGDLSTSPPLPYIINNSTTTTTSIISSDNRTPPPPHTSFKCECPELLPLDFTTHSRRIEAGSVSPRGATLLHTSLTPPTSLSIYNVAPMDLSLKKPSHYNSPVPPVVTCPLSYTELPSPPQHHRSTPSPDQTQIWDLSKTGIKRRQNDFDDDDDDFHTSSSPCVTSSSSSSVDGSQIVQMSATTSGRSEKLTNSRPVKLFKPYLLDDAENAGVTSVADVKPLVVSTGDNSSLCGYSDEYFVYSNNNNIQDFKMDYMYYKDEHSRSVNLYCPLNNDYYPNGGVHYIDDARTSPFLFGKTANSIKQRQSYSLDFKLSAIECYYSDAVCRGNQRAVASKFKIHRRQVQKWLKQEDQLRQRNEITKPMHMVR